MRERQGPVQILQSGARAGAHWLARVVRWFLDTAGGRLRVIPRIGSLAMSLVGVLLVAVAATGLAGAAAAPKPPGGGTTNPTPPAASGWAALNCSESSFFGANSTPAVPGQVGYQITTYDDETVINTNAYTGSSKNGVVPPNNTYAPQWGILDNGNWIPQPMSALSFSTTLKTTPITATIPTNLAPGTVTGWLLAWDSDQNKSGGDCGIATFTINVPPTAQTLNGHIFLCNTSTEVPGGTLAATGPVTVTATANPMTSVAVPSGAYTVNATAPAGYQFVACGGTATIGSPPTTANQNVTVPASGSGTATFYVQPVAGTLKADIYLCQGTSTTTTVEVSGGTIAASGPSTITAQANPLLLTAVTPGTYTVNATAPAGYDFTTCGSHVVIGSPPTSASNSVTVPANGTGSTVFYVVPQSGPNPITLTVTKANNADGSGTYSQSETASGPGQSVPFQVVVTNTSSVPVLITSLTDQWPSQAPFSPTCASAVLGSVLNPAQSVTCNFTLGSYSPPAGQSVTNTVLVSGCQTTNSGNCGSSIATSTVTTPPPTQPSGSVTLVVSKLNEANGSGTYAQSETATAVGQDVPFKVIVTNTSKVAVTITSLTDAWPGQAPFSPTCVTQLVGVTLAAGQSATCAWTQSGYAPAAGQSLTNTVTVVGCQQESTTNCTSDPASSIVLSPPPTAAAGSVAFTGPPAHLQLLLEIGFSMVSLGSFVLWFTRPRRVRTERS